jgi:hypothetical protein
MHRVCTLLFLLTMPPCRTAAQSRIDCPRPVRETRYRARPRLSLELGAGIARPLLYRNAAGVAGTNFRFIARSTPFASAIGYLVLSEKFDAYVGLTIQQSWQGLQFQNNDSYGRLEVNSYAGTVTTNLPLGVRYHVTPRFWLSAGPYLSYLSHKGRTGSDASDSSSFYTYRTEARNGLNIGLRLGAELRVAGRFAVAASLWGDALQSTASSGVADFSSRRGEIFTGTLQPQLIHAALGISYSIGNRSEN